MNIFTTWQEFRDILTEGTLIKMTVPQKNKYRYSPPAYNLYTVLKIQGVLCVDINEHNLQMMDERVLVSLADICIADVERIDLPGEEGSWYRKKTVTEQSFQKHINDSAEEVKRLIERAEELKLQMKEMEQELRECYDKHDVLLKRATVLEDLKREEVAKLG